MRHPDIVIVANRIKISQLRESAVSVAKIHVLSKHVQLQKAIPEM